jgi:hypothetical protein
MSDIAIGRRADAAPFKIGAIALMLALGITGFLGLIVLGAYAPDLKSGRNGGAHALSNAATGFSGLVQLAEATGRHPRIVRDVHEFDTEDLLVVAPETAAVNVSAAVQDREGSPTLFILPKWQTVADPTHRGWVKESGLKSLYEATGVLAPGINFKMKRAEGKGGQALMTENGPRHIRFTAPQQMQVITGLEDRKGGRSHSLYPVITDGKGGMVLVQVDDSELFVLADPDLLSNQGLRDAGKAASALALLDWLNNNPPEGIAFDVSMNGFGHSRSPLKLLFEPPFVVLTITILLALILAGVQAFGRFGPVRQRERALAFGKAALVDNSAALIRKAGRETRMGGRYAALCRERVVEALGLARRLREKGGDAAIDAHLDQLKGRHVYSDLSRMAAEAKDKTTLLSAAKALHDWQKEKIG